jgi:hypothetical protein
VVLENGSRQEVLARYFDRRPHGHAGAMGIIREEINKKRGHRAVRKLMLDAGSAVQGLKPVFLMSPMSVAQFLPPGRMSFDLLVIDEASQVAPEDALGIVARAKKVVVVGDDKQLPPTNFFKMVNAGGDDTEDESQNATENIVRPSNNRWEQTRFAGLVLPPRTLGQMRILRLQPPPRDDQQNRKRRPRPGYVRRA